MKALLIADTDASVHALTRHIKPFGFDIIRYRSAVKALENLEEIEPDAVFISAVDFPRHWKTLTQFIRSEPKFDDTVIVLLTDARFSADDADKAAHLGVQAIIGENPESAADGERLASIFSRYKPISGAETEVARGRIGERAVFIFTNPVNDTIITGKVDGIGPAEIRFKPDAPSAVADLAPGDILDQCSLKLDGAMLAPVCRLRKNANVMILEMTGLDEADSRTVHAFISG